MLVNLALVNNEGTTHLKELNTLNKSVQTIRIDTHTLHDVNPSLVLYPEAEEAQLSSYINKEQKFSPIYTYESITQNVQDFIESSDYDKFISLYEKSTARWILANNLKTIEQLGPTISYLKDLWLKDRNSFFEELWFLIKSNLGTQELNIIFHDLKEPSAKQAEKGEKPKLCYSYVEGKKIPQLYEGKDKESYLMKEYENEFTDIFSVTEFSTEKGQLTACGKIDLSPILVMAKLPSLNQIQQSLLIGIFNGLQ